MRDKILLLVTFGLLFIVFWQWFLPGPKVATDFSSISNSLLKSLMNLPYVWMEKPSVGLGEYTIFTLWSYPLNFLQGILANTGLGFLLIERIMYIIPYLLIGTFGFWKFCKAVKISGYARAIATLFYLANTYILLLIDGGQLNVALAYAFFPLGFLAIEGSVKGNLTAKVLAGFAAGLLGFFDIRFVYVLFLLTSASFLYGLLFLNKKTGSLYVLDWIKSGLVITAVFASLNAYWLLPYIKYPLSSEVYKQLTETSFVSLSNLGHGVLMLGPHWFKNVFGQVTQLRWEFIPVPFLVFLAPILKLKDRRVGFWLIIALLSVFLAKGTSDPLANIYPWLFQNVPGFSLFRDSSKFFFLVALSYSVLLGVSIDEITKKIKPFKIEYLFLIFTFSYLIFLIRPVWLGQMTGTFLDPPLQKEYVKFSQILETDNRYSRVFWMPTIAPLANLTSDHPSVEASRLVQKRPYASGTVGTYEIFNFLREAPYMGEIFEVSGIGYITYPYLDQRRENLHPDNIKYYYSFSEQLSKLSWVSKVEDSPIPLWKTKKNQDRFFVTLNIWVVLGSDEVYNQATKSAKLKLSKNALIFTEESPGLGSAVDKLPEAKIILNNKTPIDLAASFIDDNKLIFPAKQLNTDPDESGWWKREASDLIRWRDFLQTKYGIDNLDFDLGGGWAVGENNLKFKIKNLKLKEGHILLARVMESSRSGQLKFYQDEQLVGEIDTKKEGNNVRWFEVGQLVNDGEVAVESEGDINVVNALAVLDNDEWVRYQEKGKNLQARVADFDEMNVKNENGVEVTYQQINPTKYKVFIKNLTKPSFLIFSQTYDRYWSMNGSQALPVYSLLNGFRIERDGEYIVQFGVQKYVYSGMGVSTVSLLVIALILIKSHFKRKS